MQELDHLPDLTGGADDIVVPFQVDPLDVRGRVVRLGPSLSTILEGHRYPVPVSRLLGEAIALGLLLGTALKFEGRLILQTQTDGPVRLMVVDFVTPNQVRALARFDEERVAEAIQAQAASPAELLGRGTLALTIDQGVHTQRYQGIVALEGQGLEQAADQYFRQSEQIPTRVRLAVAEETTLMGHGWRAGGLMVQFLPAAPERQVQPDIHPGDAPEGAVLDSRGEDDAWIEARALVETIEDIELVDPDVTPERLLFRLFHEPGVRLFEPSGVEAKCSCSRERLHGVFATFTDEKRRELVEDGVIRVTCEYCSTQYDFSPDDWNSEVL